MNKINLLKHKSIIINNKIIDNKIIDNKIIDNKIIDNKIIDNKIIDNKIIDDKIIIITEDNIYNIVNELQNIKIIRIFGKGPTFKNVEKNNNDTEFHICINQTANIISDCDMLVINDLHNIYKIDENRLKNIKYILTPEYLHINQGFNKNGYFIKVYEYLKQKNFNGKYIVYNLRTNSNLNPKYITLPSCLSSSNNAIDFVCIYLNKYINLIELYGVGKCGKIYNEIFVGNGTYNNNMIIAIQNHIKQTCEKYKIKYIIN